MDGGLGVTPNLVSPIIPAPPVLTAVLSNVMQDFINDFFLYCYKDDLKSERFLKLSKDEQDKVAAQAKQRITDDVNKMTQRIQDKDPQLAISHYFHPSNRYYRKLFTMLTGIELPNSSNETRETVIKWVGQDKIDAIEQAKKDAEAAEATLKAQKEVERVNNLKEKVKQNVSICGDELVDLARCFNIEIHPQTVGMLRKRVRAINDNEAYIVGKSVGDSPWNIYKQVKSAIV